MTTSDHFRPRRRPLAWGALGAIGLAGLILSACSSPAHKDAAPPKKPTTTTSTAPPPDCPLTGAPAPERPGPPTTRPRRQDRQLPGCPTAPGRPRQGGHRLRRTRRRRHHPLRRRLPVPGRLARRTSPVGPQHRHRDPGSARHAARGARRWHQPGPGQHHGVPDRQRRPGRPPRHHDPPGRPGRPRQRLHLDRGRLRHAPHHDHAAAAPLQLLEGHPAGGTPVSTVNIDFSGTSNVTWKYDATNAALPALLQRDHSRHAGRRGAEHRGQRRRPIRPDQLRALGRELRRRPRGPGRPLSRTPAGRA